MARANPLACASGLYWSLFFAFVFVTTTAWAQEPVDFETQVAPILKKRCASCHNDEDAENDFKVSSVATILEGSSHGPAIEAGKGSASHIIKLMRGTEEPAMPPEDEFDRVPETEIAIVEAWIDQGGKPSKTAAKTALKIETPQWKAKTKVSPSILAADWSMEVRSRSLGSVPYSCSMRNRSNQFMSLIRYQEK